MEEFIEHGYKVMSNSHGYEIQINNSGDAVRLRDSNTKEISDWAEITEDGTEDGATFKCWGSHSLGEFIKL